VWQSLTNTTVIFGFVNQVTLAGDISVTNSGDGFVSGGQQLTAYVNVNVLLETSTQITTVGSDYLLLIALIKVHFMFLETST